MKKLFVLLMLVMPVALYSQENVSANADVSIQNADGAKEYKIVMADAAQTTIYISAWCVEVGTSCEIFVSASQAVTSSVTVEMRGDGGLGRFSMTIPVGYYSVRQVFYVPGSNVEIESITPYSDAYHYYQ